MSWAEDSNWERDWWGNCANTTREELLQIAYATRMGLALTPTDRTPYNIDMGGKSVLDIGGGPVSLLLKCVNVEGVVTDPCNYPAWIAQRYRAAGIGYFEFEGEHIAALGRFDECWIYNCLQHTTDPALIIKNARAAAKTIRIFEWIDAGIGIGHPHNLTEQRLNEWLGGQGSVEHFREHGADGACYYGAFQT